MNDVLIIIPTYNERENLRPITARVLAAVPAAHLLIVDDNSPDGTGEIADELAADRSNIHVLRRSVKDGLGAAYLAGFRWGLAAGFEVLVEMDADGSHPAERLPAMLRALGSSDLVIGSRWTPGGAVVDWPRSRELLSRAANRYVRLMLGLPVADATAGFRAYRASALHAIDLDGVASRGYCFQVDLTMRTVRRGLRVTEVPITFTDRTAGASKMNTGDIAEAMFRVARWALRGRRTPYKSANVDRQKTAAGR